MLCCDTTVRWSVFGTATDPGFSFYLLVEVSRWGFEACSRIHHSNKAASVLTDIKSDWGKFYSHTCLEALSLAASSHAHRAM